MFVGLKPCCLNFTMRVEWYNSNSYSCTCTYIYMCGYFYKIHVHQHEVTNNPKYMTKNRFVSKTVSDFLLRKCWEKWSNPKTEWITIIPFHPFPIASPTLLPRPGSSAGSPTGHPPMKRWRWVSHPRYGCEWSPQRWIAEKKRWVSKWPFKMGIWIGMNSMGHSMKSPFLYIDFK